MPRALEKAVRYRLLNEPGEAASICLDVLEADADNQEAIATLLLALTDQFEDDGMAALAEAFSCLERMRDEYAREYYGGIVWERRARARLRRGVPDAGPRAYEWLCEAMACYERAEAAASRQRRRVAAVERLCASDARPPRCPPRRNGEPLLLE